MEIILPTSQTHCKQKHQQTGHEHSQTKLIALIIYKGEGRRSEFGKTRMLQKCIEENKPKQTSKNRKSKKGRKEGKDETPNQTRTKTKRGRWKTGKNEVKGLRNQLQAWHSMLDTGKNRVKKCLGTKRTRLKQSLKGFLIQHNSLPRLVSGTWSPSHLCPFWKRLLVSHENGVLRMSQETGKLC